MKIVIQGCSNFTCKYWDHGKCGLPWYGRNEHGAFDTIMKFDYDHETGKLVCRQGEQ